MTLPRSVKEMSKLDFLPRHCESENFRGFSFIGDNFPIPERKKSEEDHYWNNVDDDGQSLSECASSVFDDDMNEVPPPEPEPAKKKRPPRKKKKKQQQTVPLETTNEGSEKGETESQTKTELANEKPGVEESNPNKPPSPATTLDTQKSADIVRKEEIQPLDDNKSTFAEPKLPQARLVAPSRPKLATSTAPKPLNPSSKSWHVPETQAPSLSQAVPSTQSSSTPTPAYTPKPGTWASLAVKGKPSQNHNRVTVMQQVPRAPVTTINRNLAHQTSPKKPATDWTTHVVSPRKQKLSTTANAKLVPPPPLAPGQSAWPSLGDFPPPPGAKAAPKQQKPKAIGAWGKAI